MFTTWVVGNFVRCTFEVLLALPGGKYTTDFVDFDYFYLHRVTFLLYNLIL
jgi:hypothetical protein